MRLAPQTEENATEINDRLARVTKQLSEVFDDFIVMGTYMDKSGQTIFHKLTVGNTFAIDGLIAHYPEMCDDDEEEEEWQRGTR